MSACSAKPEPAKTEAGKVEPAKSEPSAEEKRAQQVERNTKSVAKFEAEAKEAAKRWTPELLTQLAVLTKGEFDDLDSAMPQILKAGHRSPGNADRDAHRHPLETLRFCGVTPASTVIEYGAGGGWYTELVAPLVAKAGKLIVAAADPNGGLELPGMAYGKRIQLFLQQAPALYGKVEIVPNTGDGALSPSLAGKADVVLAFREMHNWHRGGNLAARAKSAFDALKPGGSLCVVQHRANADANADESAKHGYLPEDWLVAELGKVGFELAEKSEINANAKDNHDHPEGVWTLPPAYALEDVDRAKYTAIGESDRMTLRFTRPE